MIKRRKSRVVYIRDIGVGGDNEIRVESMTKVPAKNEKEIINQINELEKAGCEIVRIALPDLESCEKIPVIKKNTNIPIVGDIHFDYKIALKAIDNGIDSIRINPGNIRDKEKVKLIVKLLKERKISVRIGVNSGSIDRKKFPFLNADSMVESAMEHIKILEEEGFYDIIVSLKSTDILTTIESYEKFAKIRDYPLHIGITEAGTKFSGSIKSAIGLGILLYKGLGDTIRVSLSSSPVDEVMVAYKILKFLNLRENIIEVISCPTCARAEFDVMKIAEEVEKNFFNLRKNIKIAIMGCVVNGPGEAKDADIGFAGSGKKVALFVNGKVLKIIEPENIIKEIENYIKNL